LEAALYFGVIDLLNWIWKSQVDGSRRVSSELRHVEGRRNVTTTNSRYKRLIMKILISLLSIVLLATSLVAQDAPIPQDLPLQLRQTGEAVRRSVEQPIPQHFPLQRPTKRLDNDGLLTRLRATNRQTLATEGKVNAGSLEDRIAALEAKVEALQGELEAQKAVIKQLQELLDRQQKKN
jgi:TolA-binding protein